jgi:hypothetical protein
LLAAKNLVRDMHAQSRTLWQDHRVLDSRVDLTLNSGLFVIRLCCGKVLMQFEHRPA